MENINSRIEELKRNGYKLSFDTTFNRTLEVYKRVAMPSGLAFLIFGLFYFMIASGFTVSMIDTGRITPDSNWAEMMKELQFQLNNIPLQQRIIDGVIRILLGVLTVPMMAGAIRLCRDAETDQEITFGTMFQYYKGHYFSDLFVAGLIINVISFTLGLASQYLLEINPMVTLLLFIISLSISILTTLFVPMIIFGNLGPIEAITSSIAVVGKKFWPVLLLVFVCVLIAMLGVLACCIGIFFTLPIYPALQYSLYANSVGFEENAETSELS